MKASLVLNQGHKIKKSKVKTHARNVNAKGFCYKNMTITKQDHHKDMYLKLMLNTLKIMWDFTSIYTHWALSSMKLLKKLPTYMWPMFIHVRTNSEL